MLGAGVMLPVIPDCLDMGASEGWSLTFQRIYMDWGSSSCPFLKVLFGPIQYIAAAARTQLPTTVLHTPISYGPALDHNFSGKFGIIC